MSVTFGFYNSINKDRVYNADQVSRIFDGVISDGVYQGIPEPGNFLKVRAGSGMQVIVGPGRAWFNHTWTYNDGDLPLTIRQAPIAGGRIDAIVLVVNREDSARRNTITVIEGVPSDNPVKPTLTDTDYLFHHVLSYVTVNYGTTEITDAMIENVVGTDQTPFVAGVVRQISVSDLLTQWDNQWREYFDKEKADWKDHINTTEQEWDKYVTEHEEEIQEVMNAFNTWIGNTEHDWEEYVDNQKINIQEIINAFQTWSTSSENEFIDWFQNLEDQLDDHQAAHLQNEIDDLRETMVPMRNSIATVETVSELITTMTGRSSEGDFVTEFIKSDNSYTVRRHVTNRESEYVITYIYDYIEKVVTKTCVVIKGDLPEEVDYVNTQGDVTVDENGFITNIEVKDGNDDPFRTVSFTNDVNIIKIEDSYYAKDLDASSIYTKSGHHISTTKQRRSS